MASATLLCYSLGLAALQPVTQPGWLMVTAGAALIVELTAPYIAGAGFFSVGAALYLTLAGHPEVGVTAASVLAVCCLAARTLGRGSREPRLRQDELFNQALPVGIGLLGAALGFKIQLGGFTPLLALLLYAVAQALVAGTLWGFDNRRVRTIRSTEILLVLAICGITVQAFSAPLSALLCLPLLLLPHLLGTPLGLAYHTAHVVQQERESAQRTLSTIQERLEEVSQEHRSRAKEVQLFRRFAGSFAQSPDLKSTVELLSKEARRLVKPESVAIFLQRDGRLTPVYRQTAVAEEPAADSLEPLAIHSLKQGKPLWKKPTKPTGREFMPSQEHAVCFPLERHGTLYLGWRSPPNLTSDTLRALLALVDLGAVALGTALGLDNVRKALDFHSTGHAEARAWLERFDVLLAGVRSLAGHFSSQQVLETLKELALRLVQHDCGALMVQLGERQVLLHWPDQANLDRQALEPLGRQAVEAKRPILLERAGVWPEATSHLVAPIMADETALGAIVVARRQGTFQSSDQESLALAAVQTAIMLENCRLYEEVVESKAQLEQSQAQLVESSKLAAVGQLAAGVAHELNTPLGAIMLRIDSARRSLSKNNPEAADEKLQVAREALLNARDIVSKLLTYSGQDDRAKTTCCVEEIVRNALVLVEAQLTQQSVSVSVEQCEGVVAGRPNELTQVVINLLINARDAILGAAPQGTVIVRSGFSEGMVRLEVEDTGPGVSEKVRARIFEPFFTTKPVGTGTGLGLWISHQIVESHGGKLFLAEGMPTRFVVELPRGQ